MSIRLGLALDCICAADRFEGGEVYSIRVGLTDRDRRHAMVSAMIAVGADGNAVLWQSGIA